MKVGSCIAKKRSPEERGRIKAIILTKEFLERYKAAVPSHVIKEPELDWRGRVYVGAVDVLFHIERSDPGPEDVRLEDAKGSHTGWFVSAVANAGLLVCKPTAYRTRGRGSWLLVD